MKDDLISRQMAIDVVEESRRLNHHQDGKEACAHEYEHRHFLKLLRDLPPAQPEPAIPLQWIEAQIEWLKSLDNAFSTLVAGQISAMVNNWKGEQDG